MLFFIIRGQSAREIASRFSRSTRTIEGHCQSIKDKMRCSTLAELIELCCALRYHEMIPIALLPHDRII